MSSYKCTPTGDIDFSNGMAMVTGADEVVQLVQQRLLTIQGEWFLDTDLGLPWFKEIYKKGADLTMVEGLLKREILNTPGVDLLDSFTLVIDATTRSMTVTFSITAAAASVSGQVTLGGNQ